MDHREPLVRLHHPTDQEMEALAQQVGSEALTMTPTKASPRKAKASLRFEPTLNAFCDSQE